MKRAAIDIGTNSTRLLIADVVEKVNRIEKHTVITRLGRGVDNERRIGREGIEKNTEVMLEYKKIAESYGISMIKAIATSAVRDAVNKEEFLRVVKIKTGIDVDIISGAYEAELGFIGASSVLNGGYGLVIDIGGGSTELILGSDGNIKMLKSVDIGAVRMTERYLGFDSISKDSIRKAEDYIRSSINGIVKGIRDVHDITLIGIGGTITSLAAVDQSLEVYNTEKVHKYKLGADRVNYIFEKLTAMSFEKRKDIKGLQSGRADIIPAGSLILKVIMQELDSDFIIVSENDNLEGLLIKEYNIDLKRSSDLQV